MQTHPFSVTFMQRGEGLGPTQGVGARVHMHTRGPCRLAGEECTGGGGNPQCRCELKG